MALVNCVGSFIYFDEQSILREDKKTAWVLTKIELALDLLVEIVIDWGNDVFKQPLEYWDSK